jgi:hypothetical protein
MGISISASVHGGVTVLTESRQWTYKSSEALEDLVSGWSRMEVIHIEWLGTHMEYATHERFGGLGLKTISGWFHGFGPQNSGRGFEEEQTARGGIEEFASRQSYLMKGAVAVR